MIIRLLLSLNLLMLCATSVRAEQAARQKRPWSEYVKECLDTLIERGTDVYGPQKTPLLMSVLDIRTLASPERPEVFDSFIRLEGRIHRRGERGADLWHDQPTVRSMYLLSELTGDARYAEAADAYIRYYLDHCRKPNGLLVWGSHIYWDCYRDRPAGDADGAGPHEILVHQCHWKDLYRINPDAVRQQIDGIWKWHVHDHETGRHNRHDDGQPGADFPFSGGSFIEAFAFLHSVTPGDSENLARAKLVTDWHWRHRNPETNLVAFQPGNLLSDREAYHFYGRTFASAVTGPHAARLLHSYELTGAAHFREVANAYLLAYDRYGWIEDAQTFVGMLNLDGTVTTAADAPADYQSQLAGRAQEPSPEYSVPPIGPVDIWPTTIFPLDFPLLTAQASIYAYELTPEEDVETREALLRMARHWAIAIESAMPPRTGRTFRQTFAEALPESVGTGGTYAANYGRAISFFVHLHRATGEQKYLHLAETLASEAVEKLYTEAQLTSNGDLKTYGIFKGHPAKPYYESVNGVGFLLLALLELDNPAVSLGGAF